MHAVRNADWIKKKYGHRAVHVARDLGFAGRDDSFQVDESRRLKMILVTKDRADFKRGSKILRGHSGIIVLGLPDTAGTERILGEIDNVFAILRDRRLALKDLRSDGL